MLEFLKTNWLTVLIVLIVVGYIIYLAVSKQWERIRKLAYAAMLKAERVYTDNQGEEKFNRVLDALYSKLPIWIRLCLSKEDIKTRLQEWYDSAKDFLDDGQINGSV